VRGNCQPFHTQRFSAVPRGFLPSIENPWAKIRAYKEMGLLLLMCCFLHCEIPISPYLRRKPKTHYSISRRKTTEISHSVIQRSNKDAYRLIFYLIYGLHRRSQWPRGLRHELSSLGRTLGSWVRIPLKAGMFAFILCVGSGLASGWSPVQETKRFTDALCSKWEQQDWR
jgi:hypothetical protein